MRALKGEFWALTHALQSGFEGNNLKYFHPARFPFLIVSQQSSQVSWLHPLTLYLLLGFHSFLVSLFALYLMRCPTHRHLRWLPFSSAPLPPQLLSTLNNVSSKDRIPIVPILHIQKISSIILSLFNGIPPSGTPCSSLLFQHPKGIVPPLTCWSWSPSTTPLHTPSKILNSPSR